LRVVTHALTVHSSRRAACLTACLLFSPHNSSSRQPYIFVVHMFVLPQIMVTRLSHSCVAIASSLPARKMAMEFVQGRKMSQRKTRLFFIEQC
jgi:hypothetical protein